jgi:predicted RNA-binding protein with PIN domain
MTLVIDGHNLIPKVPGLHLTDLDDEPQLIQLVQEYCRLRRTNAELFFDGALPGMPGVKTGGLVHVHGVKKGITADQAMIEFLSNKGKGAKNYTLVSSDRRVQAEARSLGCAVISSDQFSAELVNTLSKISEEKKKQDKPLSQDEVEDWLTLFIPQRNKL